MRKRVNPYLINDDSPELTKADFARMRPAREVFTENFGKEVTDIFFAANQGHLAKQRGERGKQKSPTKQPVHLRLDADVVAHFKMAGKGWQTRVNNVLRAAMGTSA